MAPDFGISVTGTRHGASELQLDAFRRHLALLYARGCRTLRHGCCVGFDTQAALLGREFLMEVIAHPGNLADWTSLEAIAASTRVESMKLNRDRNRDLADHAIKGGVLIACPGGREHDARQRASGTWQVVRMGRNCASTAVILPDGSVTYSLWDRVPG